jgi:CDGSH-type Zn-finger protein
MGKIKVTKGGPYVVTGGVPIHVDAIVPSEDGGSEKWEKGTEFQHGDEYHICRCGHSSHKPFCDGTHVKVGFEGEETADKRPYMEKADIIKGGTVELYDESDLCAGARFCDRFGGVWNLAQMSSSEHPEIEQMAIYEATNCPSGRLVIKKNGEFLEKDFEGEGIGALHDTYYGIKGPYAVKGGIPVESADGDEYEVRNRITLCRCGMSSNLPFCDGSHFHADHMKGIDDE